MCVCVCVRSIVRPWRNFQNGRNKRRYRLATITGGELVKRLETCVGGNVKVSEWPIQCAVASGQTGPRSLAVFIWHARHSRGGRDERERETGYATTRDTTEKHRQTETGETANDKKTRRGNSIYRGKTDGNVQATAERKKERERARMNVRTRLSRTEGQKFLRFGVLSIRPDREKDAVSKDRKSRCQLESKRQQPSSLVTWPLSFSLYLCVRRQWRVFERTLQNVSGTWKRATEIDWLARVVEYPWWFTASLAPSTRHESTTGRAAGRGEKDKFHRSAKMGRR